MELRLAIIATLFAGVLTAEQASTANSTGVHEPSTFRTRMVKLAVVAADNRGNPVQDLTANEFQISDAGTSQPIELFRPGRDKPGPRTAPRLEAGEKSNRDPAAVPKATVILFDLLNQNPAARAPAQARLVRGLQEFDATGDTYLYVLTLAGRVHAIRGLRREGTAETGGSGWAKNGKAINHAINSLVGFARVDINIDQRVRLTYRAMTDVARLLAGVQAERKSIVWVTHGVPISLGTQGTDGVSEPVDYEPLLRSASSILDRIGISIYPVQQLPPGTTIDGSLAGTGGDVTLRRLAELTGGVARYDSDIMAAVHQAMHGDNSGYLLDYTPSAGNWDGKYHKLQVTSSREGIRLQVKSGYYAGVEGPNDDRENLREVLASPFDVAEIGVRASLANDTGVGMRLKLRIDLEDVALSENAGRFIGHLALQAAGVEARGSVEQTAIVPLEVNLSAAVRAGMLLGGIEYAMPLTPKAGWTQVRIAVLDRNTHAIGSISVPVK